MDTTRLIDSKIINAEYKLNPHIKKIIQEGIVNDIIQEVYDCTNFLRDTADLKERVYCIVNNVKNKPVCTCGNDLNFRSGKYNTFCCNSCSKKDPARVATRKLKQNETTAKSKATWFAKYGFYGNLTRPDVLAKTHTKQEELYGGIGFKSSTIQTKAKAKVLEVYDVTCAANNLIVRKLVHSNNWKKYGTISPNQSQIIKDKTKANFVLNNNVEHYTQLNFKPSVFELLNDKDWLIEQHHNEKLTITHIANKLEIDNTTLGLYFKKYNIEVKYFAVSMGERELNEFITTLVDTEVISRSRAIISPYELDIYIPALKLAIEYGGVHWHSDQFVDSNYHKMKYEKCTALGIRLITMFEDEWIDNKQLVKKKLINIVGKSIGKVFARKCKIVNVTPEQRKQFLDVNHLQGNGKGSVIHGLTYNNELVAVTTYFKSKDGYELNRFATNTNVVGGFSKLIKYFIRTYNTNIYTAADLRWSQGDLYNKNGFILTHFSKPSYEYVINGKRVHRTLFSISNLKLKLKDKFDPNLTEKQNMANNNWYQIHNCGLVHYKLIPNVLLV